MNAVTKIEDGAKAEAVEPEMKGTLAEPARIEPAPQPACCSPSDRLSTSVVSPSIRLLRASRDSPASACS